MEPERFGPYTLLRRLATGGMGELFLAQRTGSASYSSLVVVKRIRSDLLDEEGFVEMFLGEAKVASLIDHPNVVRIFEWGEVEGTYFIVMEYVAGKDLGTVLKRRAAPLDLSSAVFVMVSICEGLGYAHHAVGPDGRPLQIVHRDINPQNVLASYAGAVKLTDFGIAKVQMEQRQKTRAGVLKGKFGYLSPEQARGLPVDQRSDIYALGLLLFELTVGRRANPGRNDSEMLFSAAEGRLLYPSQVVTDYPPGLERIYSTATAERPDQRFATARQMQEALLAFQLEHRVLATGSTLAELMQSTFAEDWNDERKALTPVSRVSHIDKLARTLDDADSQQPRTGPYRGLTADPIDPVAPTRASQEFEIPRASPGSRPRSAPQRWEEPSGVGGGSGTQAFSPTQIGARMAAGAGLHPVPSEPGMVVDRPPFEDGPTPVTDGPELFQQLSRTDPGLDATLFDKPSPSARQVTPSRPVTPVRAAHSRAAQSLEARAAQALQAVDSGSLDATAPVPRVAPEPAPARPRVRNRLMVILASSLFSLGLGGGMFYMFWSRHAGSSGDDMGTAPPVQRHDLGSKVVATPISDSRPWPRPDLKPDLGAPLPPDAGRATVEPDTPGPGEVERPGTERGQLRVTSTPPLMVYWRGRKLGNTPGTFTLPAGKQVLALRNPNLRIDLTRRVTIAAARRAAVEVTVGKGKLDLRVRPWATVEVDGRKRGQTPMQPLELYEGHYTIRLSNPDFEKPQILKVTIRPDEVTKVVHVFKK